MQVSVDQDECGLMRSASACSALIGSTRSRTVSGGIGHTDTDHSTCLHVPSIDLVMSGDAVYNGAHLYLAESNRQPLTFLPWKGPAKAGCHTATFPPSQT
jgi:hypothetical protein